MNAFFLAEEGPLSGLLITLKDKEEWIIGRDPENSDIVLEDPMVSRRHAKVILRHEGYFLENFSTVNPITQNGKVVVDTILLSEGDILLIGTTYFKFTNKNPQDASPLPAPSYDENTPLNLNNLEESRWLLKVVAGPNSGAESGLKKGQTYLVGKDAALCDIILQDLSISRQHARITLDLDDKVFIEDLSSRNGVVVNGKLIESKQEIHSQDLVSLGTTSFLLIDRELAAETIVAEPLLSLGKKETNGKASSSWKEMVIPKKHLFLAGFFAVLMIGALASMFSLFKTSPVMIAKNGEMEKVKEKLDRFPGVQFSLNLATGKIFLIGNVLTSVEHEEMVYLLKSLSFIRKVEDNVVIDDLVSENMNALLATNSNWQGVTIHAIAPGKFSMTGYLETIDEAEALSDYINLNFPYLEKLDNQVVVESNLKTQIISLFFANGLNNVGFELSNGELVLSGQVDEESDHKFKEVIQKLKETPGIRRVDNYVVLSTTTDTKLIDLSSKYNVSGYSRRDDTDFYVVIGGKILGKGDLLDGMTVTGIGVKEVFLEKDGLKYKINYNPS